ncbi:MAG: PaaI family thioesterase [Myxococcales bacterium]|nr:PaaI family thioesterase [Myxococcales bacterium]
MTSDLAALLAEARASGDPAALAAAVPYARFIGFSVERDQAGLVGRLRYAPHLVGNSLLPALHGGTLGSLLESIAMFELLLQSNAPAAPRIISITVEYLRSARPVDTLARAEITRHGRRVATVRAVAWQEDPGKPVAAANAHFLLAAPEE